MLHLGEHAYICLKGLSFTILLSITGIQTEQALVQHVHTHCITTTCKYLMAHPLLLTLIFIFSIQYKWNANYRPIPKGRLALNT